MFKLTREVRVHTAEGDASFYDADGLKFVNEYGRQQIVLPEGTEVRPCAHFAKTDTFMVTVTIPETVDEEDDEVTPALLKGLVLRLASWEKLLSASEPEGE